MLISDIKSRLKKSNLQLCKMIFGTFSFFNFLIPASFSQVEIPEGELNISEFKPDSSDTYFFESELAINDSTFIETYKDSFGLTEYDEMVLISSFKDDLGYSHKRFRQYYKGLEVEGGTFILHSIDGNLIIANGELIQNLSLTNEAAVSENDALSTSLAEINAEEYAWQNEDWEAELKLELESDSASYYPTAVLLYARDPNSKTESENYHLAYCFEIIASNPEAGFKIYIDATTGNFIKKTPLNRNTCTDHTGSGTLMYYGYQTFNVKVSGSDYILEDCTRGDGIETKWENCPGGIPANCNITDGDGNWGTDDQKGTTVHWCAQKAWDYYANTFSRNSMDNSGNKINLKADWDHENSDYNHSILGSDRIRIGTTDYYLGRLDIVGHEFTHGVCHYTADFEYPGTESGALEESYCDIFGEAIERYILGSNDWFIGDPGGSILIGERSFVDPHTYDDPEYYGEYPYWTTDDTHSCALVQDRWFYFLSVGSTAHVTGIGFDKAIKIAYRTLTIYLDETSDFADARTWSIQSAKDLYGNCSNEVLMTTNAWAEVGLGSALPYIFCTNIGGVTLICEEELNDIDYVFNATGIYNGLTNPTGMTFSWAISPSTPAWSYALSGTGYKTMTVTNINGMTDRSIGVIASFAGNTSSASHVVNIEDCEDCPPFCKFGTFENENDASFTVFPNPVNLNVNYNISNYESGCAMTIFDIRGNLILAHYPDNATGSISLVNFPPGIYLVKLTDNENSKTKMIQIIK